MLNTQENLEKILPNRPTWSEVNKTKYVDNLNIINENYSKLLAVHHNMMQSSLEAFDYVTDLVAEFVTSYIRGK